MFDFRYHALSLVAVFLALAIGILLGATIGDSLVSEAVAGGSIDSVSTFDIPSQLNDLETAAQGKAPLAGIDPDLVKAFGKRIGRSLVNAGELTQQLHKNLPDALRGDFQGAASVAYYRAPPPDKEDPKDKALREAFEDGLVAGLESAGVQTVGVEEQGTDPSQVSWYGDHKMSSVDSVDLPGGRLALVFVLNGEKGAYGIKSTADAPLPKLPIGSGGTAGTLGG